MIAEYKFPIPRTVHSKTRKYMRSLLLRLSEENLITPLDEGALTVLMQCHENWIKATEIVQKEGYVIADTNSRGLTVHKSHPALTIQKNATIQLAKLFSQFGLTPASRKQVSGSKPKKLSSLDQFLQE